MARQARGESIDPLSIQIVHITSRCVRQSFLCGKDPITGRCLEHRRNWIRDRLEFLASVFALDCLTYTVMGNHVHQVLRSRPDIVETWSDKEVAERWLRLCPSLHSNGKSGFMTFEQAVHSISADPLLITELRIRLSDISWWMKRMSEDIARKANREDEATGAFWEGRFHTQVILDEASLLACSMYVDLNPIRAAIAITPESSEFTGANDRICDLKQVGSHLQPDASSYRSPSIQRERNSNGARSGWLSPIEIRESADPMGVDVDKSGRRASKRGFLPISLSRYLQLLDWTGRQIRSDKRGSIPSQLSPILERLRIEPKGWPELIKRFGRLFKRAAGNRDSISKEATQRNLSWMQAPGAVHFG